LIKIKKETEPYGLNNKEVFILSGTKKPSKAAEALEGFGHLL
jgi:hypothetical protein